MNFSRSDFDQQIYWESSLNVASKKAERWFVNTIAAPISSPGFKVAISSPPTTADTAPRIGTTICVMRSCAAAAAVPTTNEPYRVLVLHSYRNSLPINTDWYNGLVRGSLSDPGMDVWIDVETLDLARVRDEGYLNSLGGIFRRKYADPKPQLIIPRICP
jgi:hypothetical protein